MKITDILVKRVSFERKKVFKIAFSVSKYVEGVYVKIVTDEGIYGLGEAMPFAPVTGETIETVMAVLSLLKERLLGEDPCNLEKIHAIMDAQIKGNTAAKAAIDFACYDILGKAAGMPVYKLLGGFKNSIVTDITVGIDTPENMANDAKEKAERGFNILKIKCGADFVSDCKAVEKIRKAVGENVELRIDVNQGYSVSQAVNVFEKMKSFGVTEAEQPVKASDISGLSYLRKKTSMPIMADESVHSPEDAALLCKNDACDFINIKLMKSGGIYPALKINAIAQSYGIPCIVGCMSESRLGISAGAALACAKANIHDCDLDSFMSFKESEGGISGGFEINKNVITVLDKPGFGFDEYEF